MMTGQALNSIAHRSASSLAQAGLWTVWTATNRLPAHTAHSPYDYGTGRTLKTEERRRTPW
jgi:hypothetical protein